MGSEWRNLPSRNFIKILYCKLLTSRANLIIGRSKSWSHFLHYVEADLRRIMVTSLLYEKTRIFCLYIICERSSRVPLKTWQMSVAFLWCRTASVRVIHQPSHHEITTESTVPAKSGTEFTTRIGHWTKTDACLPHSHQTHMDALRLSWVSWCICSAHIPTLPMAASRDTLLCITACTSDKLLQHCAFSCGFTVTAFLSHALKYKDELRWKTKTASWHRKYSVNFWGFPSQMTHRQSVCESSWTSTLFHSWLYHQIVFTLYHYMIKHSSWVLQHFICSQFNKPTASVSGVEYWTNGRH